MPVKWPVKWLIYYVIAKTIELDDFLSKELHIINKIQLNGYFIKSTF
jgi:hypothetical protein